MAGETLPGVDTHDDRIVLHVDMDCFYASCERRREPSLRGEPVVVGMGYEPGETIGAVATASYEAREYGVESAQPISQALEALPRVEDAESGEEPRPSDDAPAGHYRPVDMDYYQSVAAEVKAVLHDCADVVREVSIDEAYLDVTDRTSWQVADGRTLAEGYARHVKERIERAVGVPASVGVASNMSTAKVASDADKPDGLVVVPPGEAAPFLAPLDVDALHGVGPVTARELRDMGLETAGDVAAADAGRLREAFGKRGRELHDRARGYDDREVTPTGQPKSLNREKALEATDDVRTKHELVGRLAVDVAERARSRGADYRTIGIKVVTPPYDVQTRERSLPGPVDDPGLVREVALDLLTEFDGERVRKLGVRVSNLTFSPADQSRLDGWGEESRSRTASSGTSSAATGEQGATAEGQAALSDFERSVEDDADGTDPDPDGEERRDDGVVTLRDFEERE